MTFLRVIGFSIALLAFYAVYSHTLPQVEPDLSEPEEVSTEGLDMAGMIAFGEDLFSGKGTCTLCHNNLGRAPDTLEMDLAVTFNERLSDPANAGVGGGVSGPDAVEEYIRKSMLDPSIYVVAGYGKKGTNDTESPMPVVDQPPIELNAVEINALIAFLQDRAGMAPTVPLPSADETPVAEESSGADGMVEAPETDIAEALDKFACSACHDLNDSGADLGPPLGGVAARMDRTQLMGAILDPNAEIAEGFEEGLMPDTLSEDMHASELMLIVDYLMLLPEAVVSEEPADAAPITDVIGVIDEYSCSACHDLEGSDADLGPRLNGIGARMDRATLRASIVDPNAEIAEGYEAELMPDDFGETMSDDEMNLILDYLMNLGE